MANIAGGDLDALSADSDIFTYYANQQVFADLRDVLSPDQIAKYEDLFVYVDQSYIDYLNSEEYQDYISTGNFDASNKYAVMADKYNKDFIMPNTEPSKMENPVPVGIRLTSSEKLSESGAYSMTNSIPVIGVMINTKRPEVAVQFLEYLLG